MWSTVQIWHNTFSSLLIWNKTKLAIITHSININKLISWAIIRSTFSILLLCSREFWTFFACTCRCFYNSKSNTLIWGKVLDRLDRNRWLHYSRRLNGDWGFRCDYIWFWISNWWWSWFIWYRRLSFYFWVNGRWFYNCRILINWRYCSKLWILSWIWSLGYSKFISSWRFHDRIFWNALFEFGIRRGTIRTILTITFSVQNLISKTGIVNTIFTIKGSWIIGTFLTSV